MSFRQMFKLKSKPIRWFPGHMAKGLRQMQHKLKAVDCIIEVHDARIPFSGRNPEFQNTITGGGVKPHILVLNKKDLTDVREQRKIANDLKKHEGIDNVVFTNCKNHQCSGIKGLLPMAKDLIYNSERFNRTNEKDLCLMVIGVPNVGKSSLLNVVRNRYLKKKGAAGTGAVAGVTRNMSERIKICDDPLIYMVDTPGVLEPRIGDDEMGMKLALVGCLPDHLVGEDVLADYLLYYLNRRKRYDYVSLMGLKAPTDNISELLLAYADRKGLVRKLRTYDMQVAQMPDTLAAAKHFVKLFRKGELGLISLDRV